MGCKHDWRVRKELTEFGDHVIVCQNCGQRHVPSPGTVRLLLEKIDDLEAICQTRPNPPLDKSDTLW